MTSDDRPGERAADNAAPGVEEELREDRYVGGRDLTRWRTRAGDAIAAFARWVGARMGPYTALVITLLVGLALVFLLSVAAVEVYDAVADEDGVAGIDEPLLLFMLGLRSPGLDVAVTAFTDVAGTIGMPVIAVLGMVVLGLTRRSWTPVVIIAAAGTGSLLMTIAGKELIQRERPPLIDAVPPFEYSPSFPSGHTLNAVAVVGAIAYLLVLRRTSRGARIAVVGGAVAFDALVGMSRVYLGHHWFTDVLVGWILGALWLALLITAHRLYLTIREQPRHRPAAIS
ncbi:phosphatase PAP2 family protein [Microbacterium sp. P06]|uniref:phosphatase PAP2 family protein n=1 Tax=Microbacterium sp. P06 TaxID=3366949 RepID=UPI003746FB62